MASFHGDWVGSYRAERSIGWKLYLAPLVAWRSRRIFELVARETDHLFTVGEDLKNDYAPERNDVCVFANFLVTEKDPLERSDACAGTSLNLLFVGALSPRKGVRYLIDAAKEREKIVRGGLRYASANT